MLSPSSLFTKIIGVLARNGGGKWNQTLVSSMSLLNMALVYIRVGLGTSHFIICLPTRVWVISFDLSSSLCLVTMTSYRSMSNTAKFRSRVANMFKRSSFFSFLPLIPSFSLDSLSTYSFFSCRWCGKHDGPPSTGHFLSISANYPGS